MKQLDGVLRDALDHGKSIGLILLSGGATINLIADNAKIASELIDHLVTDYKSWLSATFTPPFGYQLTVVIF